MAKFVNKNFIIVKTTLNRNSCSKKIETINGALV